METVHERNHNVRAACSNSTGDGLCVGTHHFPLFTQRCFNHVYLLKKRKRGIPGCLFHTQTRTHTLGFKAELFVCSSLLSCLFLQSSSVTPSEPGVLTAPPLVSRLWKERIRSIFSTEQHGEAPWHSTSDHTLAAASQHPLLMDLFLEITHSSSGSGLHASVILSKIVP